MSSEERKPDGGFEVHGRITVGRAGLATVASLFGVLGASIGMFGSSFHVGDPAATAQRLQQCRSNEERLTDYAQQCAAFTDEVVSILEALPAGKRVTLSLSVPILRHAERGDVGSPSPEKAR